MIRHFCNECGKVEFDESHLQWYEQNGDEPIFCKDCWKQRCEDNGEEFDSQNTDNSFEFEVTILVGSG